MAARHPLPRFRPISATPLPGRPRRQTLLPVAVLDNFKLACRWPRCAAVDVAIVFPQLEAINANSVFGCGSRKQAELASASRPRNRRKQTPMPDYLGHSVALGLLHSACIKDGTVLDIGAFPRIVQENYAPGMSVSLVARQYGIAPNQVFTWRRLYAEGALLAVGAGEEVLPASEYRALQHQVRELQRLLGKKTLENEVLRDALALAQPKKRLLRSSLSARRPGDR